MNKNNSGAKITSFVFFGLCILFFILAWTAGSGWAVAFYISLAVGLFALFADYEIRNKPSSHTEKEKPTPWIPPAVSSSRSPIVPPPTVYVDPTNRDKFNESLNKTPSSSQQPPHPDTVLAEYYKRKHVDVKPPPPPPPPRPKGLINDRYELAKKLKDGGMAEISLAKDWDNGQKQVIIKKPRRGTDHAQQLNFEKLLQEAEYIRSVSHPNIVKFIDSFYDQDKMPNLVVEYIDGGDLLNKYKFASADEQVAVKSCRQILDALEYIHGSGFIHRDLNPGNIMAKASGDVTLIDFGTVKESGYSSDTVFFKPGFVIPEVSAKGYADKRSDIYGVGSTLYYMLTCERPGFIKERDVVSLLIEKGVSQRTAKCVDQALQLDPNFRFQSADAMRRALTGG